MSADLQFRLQDLPPIQFPFPKLNLPPPQQESSCRSQLEQIEECVTPTSTDHRIPAILICPPAPKKQRHASPSCKRRLQFQFFEIVATDEIDSFFTSSYEFINNRNSSRKRRCIL
ncbi:hypothetical protein SSX86_020519 [Deinandra increscens subsp. villosa]|uniref:Uncharacterized protein n=1 Tax=Deinandra increscens subsp. villosa TaxID=3103831 RepID=A0AAP0CN31_9ASTR